MISFKIILNDEKAISYGKNTVAKWWLKIVIGITLRTIYCQNNFFFHSLLIKSIQIILNHHFESF